MADGTFAVALIVLGVLDMNANHCGSATGCLGRSEVTPRWALSAGQSLERQQPIFTGRLSRLEQKLHEGDHFSFWTLEHTPQSLDHELQLAARERDCSGRDGAADDDEDGADVDKGAKSRAENDGRQDEANPSY